MEAAPVAAVRPARAAGPRVVPLMVVSGGSVGFAAARLPRGVRTVADVAAKHLCCGCGACAYVRPDGIQMVDVLDQGRRPLVEAGAGGDAAAAEAVMVCPGASLEHTFDENDPGLIQDLIPEWGPVRRVWEGFAADPELRFRGSSGGAASALALYAIERGGMYGLLHTAARPEAPYLNHTVLSRGRDEILAATGSRYAPASPGDGLGMVEAAPRACVFIGKPCDVAGADRARRLRPGLDAKLGLTIAVFCAGTPSTNGTLEMLRRMGVTDLSSVVSVRYRGNGWPGSAVVTLWTDGGRRLETREMSYAESWGGVLTKHQQWRCRICPDHTGEFADVSVGDPWYRPIPEGEPGRSLVVARTRRGERMVEAAIAAGYLTLEPVDASVIAASQPNLLKARGAVWGRVWASRLMGAAAPRYTRVPTFRVWWTRLSLKEKAKSLYGTAKRVLSKGILRPAVVKPFVSAGDASMGRGPQARAGV
jgi:coenzyme F420 hydrogenase subunit beta